MKISEIITELQNDYYKDDGCVYVTSGEWFYSYKSLSVSPAGVIYFSDKIEMPVMTKKSLLEKLSVFRDNVLLAINLDTNKTYEIVEVNCDEDDEMGSDIYLFIND